MNTKALKSIGAVLAGLIVGAVLSIGTDFLMDALNVFSMANFKETPFTIIVLVILYRFVFNVLGCYLCAKLAPSKPMRHALAIGVIGTVVAIVGALAMWDEAMAFYNLAIIIISLPSAWVGGKLFLRNQSNG